VLDVEGVAEGLDELCLLLVSVVVFTELHFGLRTSHSIAKRV